MANFLRQAVSAVRGYTDRAKAAVAAGGSRTPGGSELMPMREFRKELQDKMSRLHVDAEFARRYLNDGFSGGEKKRAEILQMAMLEPKIAILDETDSGLDIDALRVVSEGVNSLIGPQMGALLITHYQRLLNYIRPDHVHVFYGGRVVLSGGPELALELESKGYDWIRQQFGEPTTASA
jgi:Fe-S cluster assembly ATP-binding protein